MIAKNLEGHVSVPVVKAKSHLPFPLSACRIFPQQLPDMPASNEWYVQLHYCALLCRLPLNTYSTQRKLQCECHCDVPVGMICLPQGDGTCVFQAHHLLRLHTGARMTMVRGGKHPCCLLFLMVSFSSFFSGSWIIFCSVTPCGMKKNKARVYQLLFSIQFSVPLYNKAYALLQKEDGKQCLAVWKHHV